MSTIDTYTPVPGVAGVGVAVNELGSPHWITAGLGDDKAIVPDHGGLSSGSILKWAPGRWAERCRDGAVIAAKVTEGLNAVTADVTGARL